MVTDHESILLISQKLDNLEKSQTEFHKEVRQNFDELKNNYSSTLSLHESRIRKLEEMTIDPDEHKALIASMNANNIYLKWMVALLVVLIGVMSVHILGIRIP